MTERTRRELLCALSASAGASLAGCETTEETGETEETQSASSAADFDPAVDGFGFDNYSTPPIPDVDEIVSEETVRELITDHWQPTVRGRPTGSLDDVAMLSLRTSAADLYANVDDLFGMNGYCYGMAVAAQSYFEEPTVVPLGRDSASEFTHLNAPLDRERTPVRDDIERFHRSQFLVVESWLSRRPLLRPERIDYRSQARELRAAIDEFGSAGITITGRDVLESHYVLLYAYDVTEIGVTFSVYDPNYAAERYANADDPLTVAIDTTSYEPVLRSYDSEYDHFLIDRSNRAVRGHVESKR